LFVLFSRVPGLAFRNQRPYLELQQLELLRLASTEIQIQFFQVIYFSKERKFPSKFKPMLYLIIFSGYGGTKISFFLIYFTGGKD